MSHFKTGDVVRIMSGGPTMTVNTSYGSGVDCDWFDADGNLHHATFRHAQLTLLTLEDAKAISSWFQEAQLHK